MKVVIHNVKSVNLEINKSNPPQLSILAKGMVTTGGWKNGELSPHVYADGIWDFTFLATPPAVGDTVTMGFEKITANILVPIPVWLEGVRIHASTGDPVVALLSETKQIILGTHDLPWPWIIAPSTIDTPERNQARGLFRQYP